MKTLTHFVRFSVALVFFSGGYLQAKEGKKAEVKSSASSGLKTTDLFEDPVKKSPTKVTPKKIDPNAVVLKVNGEEIKEKEIDSALQFTLGQFQRRGYSMQQLQQMVGTLRKNVEDQLITNLLVNQAMKKENLTIDPKKVDKKLEEIRTKFKESPLAKKGMTFEALLKKQGMTVEKIKENLTKQLKVEKFFNSLVKDVKAPSEEEVKKFYEDNPKMFIRPESVLVSHILVKVDKKDDAAKKAEKKAKIEKIRKDIISGAITFEDAAKKNSDCPSKANGGLLPRFVKGDPRLDSAFALAAFTQEKGEIGDVIESAYGYHIIKVKDHQRAEKFSFEKVKKWITARLMKEKEGPIISSYIKKLRDSAKIERFSE